MFVFPSVSLGEYGNTLSSSQAIVIMEKDNEKRSGCLPFFLRFLAIPAEEKEAKKEPPQDGLELQYTLKKSLLTSAEINFYKRLLEAVGGKLAVFAQVRIADVLEVKKGANWNKLFPKIKAKHFDFVLCHPQTLQILAVIELDDSTHAQRKRQERDRFVNQICGVARLNLIRVTTSSKYDLKELRSKIQNAVAPRQRQSGESP